MGEGSCVFHIVACDNDQADLDALEILVDGYLKKHPECNGDLRTFSSAAELMSAVEARDGRFDAFLLDIIMPDCDGIELGAAIRAHDPHAPIIYITSSKEFALEAFGVHALRYLIKPIDYDELVSALDEAFASMTLHPARKMEINGKRGMTVVDLDAVVCVENSARSALYTISDGTQVEGVCNRSNFEESVGPIAAESDFLHPHKSYFVNMHHVRTIRADKLVLDNGREVPISRRNVAEVKKRYIGFLAKEGMGD